MEFISIAKSWGGEKMSPPTLWPMQEDFKLQQQCKKSVSYEGVGASYIKIASEMPVPHSLGKYFSTP